MAEMDMKEKLVELLNNSFDDQYGKRGLLTAPHTADHLIANGVTVQKWIPVTERLPELSGEYLVYCGEYDGICVLYYEILKTKGKWRSNWKEVTHWMPLPEPPKEEL